MAYLGYRGSAGGAKNRDASADRKPPRLRDGCFLVVAGQEHRDAPKSRRVRHTSHSSRAVVPKVANRIRLCCL